MLLQRHRAIESIGNDAKLTDVETQAASAALVLMDLNVSGVSCIANVSRFGRADCTASLGHPNCHFQHAFASMTTTAGAYYRVAIILLEIPSPVYLVG
jgi:hypothetical protein